jgi:hypothetical protein
VSQPHTPAVEVFRVELMRRFSDKLSMEEIADFSYWVVGKSSVPKVTMQMLFDAGFNAFGLQLFCESFAGKTNPEKPDAGLPFSFSFRGLRFTVEREPGEEIDVRHH